MSILRQDLSYTFRRLSRSPGFAIAVILSISLGIAANATIFSMVSRFVLRPAPVGDPSTLRALYTLHDGDQCCNNFPLPAFEDVRDQATSFSGVSAYNELRACFDRRRGRAGESLGTGCLGELLRRPQASDAGGSRLPRQRREPAGDRPQPSSLAAQICLRPSHRWKSHRSLRAPLHRRWGHARGLPWRRSHPRPRVLGSSRQCNHARSKSDEHHLARYATGSRSWRV